MAELTPDDVANWHMREAEHHNGGEVFFAYLHRCVEQPRLSRYVRYARKDRSVTSTWRTDGVDMPSMAAAVEALNVEPLFDEAELALLKTVPDDFTDIRTGIDWSVNDRLVNKGAVEWQYGKCRITPAGRTALSSGKSDG